MQPSLPQCLIPTAICPPGAEPLAHVGGRVGVLVLHGFTGSPWEVRPLAEILVLQGYSVAMPILAGHCTTVTALAETTWSDWLTSARDALKWLHLHTDRVHCVGLSMGALLAILLSLEMDAADDPRLVALAPAFAFHRWQRAAVLTFARVGFPANIGKAKPLLAGDLVQPCYSQIPLRGAKQLLELMDVTRACAWPQNRRSLVIHGDRDLTIPAADSCRRASYVLGPLAQIVRIPKAGHLLPRTNQASEVIDLVLAELTSRRVLP